MSENRVLSDEQILQVSGKHEVFAKAVDIVSFARAVESAVREALAAQGRESAEPVAWVNLDTWQSGEHWPDDCFAADFQGGMVPLYTHPAPTSPAEPSKVEALIDMLLAEANKADDVHADLMRAAAEALATPQPFASNPDAPR